MKKVRLAVLGTNGRGSSLADLDAKHPQVELVSFCDIAKGLAENISNHVNKKYGLDTKYFMSYEKLLKGPAFDAMLIACDPDIQVEYACDAMKRGIHVMTEVPAAFSIKQCWDLVNTVKSTGVKYMLGEQTRYAHHIKKLGEMAAKGEFGKIVCVEGEYMHYEPKWDYFVEKSTGLRFYTNDPSYNDNPDYEPSWRYRFMKHPMFYPPHELSPLLSITGGRITKVCCMGTKPESYATKGFHTRDIETAIMYNSDDIVFTLRASFTAPLTTPSHWFQILGTQRSVEWNRTGLDSPKMFTAGKGWEVIDWPTVDPEADEITRSASHGGLDYYPIVHFVDAIINDKTPPLDVYKAVETAAPGILSAESSEKGGVMLEVPDFRK